MGEVAIPTNPMTDFQDKLRGRVRDDIRDLLPDAALAELVKRAIDEEFFTPRYEKEHSGWNARDIKRPSWFAEEVVKAAGPIIQAEVRKIVTERLPSVEEIIVNFLNANKLAVATSAELTALLGFCIQGLQQELQNHRR